MPGARDPKSGAAAPREYHFPHFERRTLDNGTAARRRAGPKLPLVTVLAMVDAGASASRTGKDGVAALTAQLLLEGTAGWTARSSPSASSASARRSTRTPTGTSPRCRSRRSASICRRRSSCCGEVSAHAGFPEREVSGSRRSGSPSCCSCAPSRAGWPTSCSRAQCTTPCRALCARRRAATTRACARSTRDDVLAF